MDELSVMQEIMKVAPAWLIVAYFVYKLGGKIVDAYQIKKLKKAGIKVNGDKRLCQGDLKVLVLAVADMGKKLDALGKRQEEDRFHYGKELAKIMECQAKNMDKVKTEIHEQIDNQTTVLAEKQDTGNGLLSKMLGNLETMVAFLAGRQ